MPSSFVLLESVVDPMMRKGTDVILPYVEAVQVEIRPLLGLPPVVPFSLHGLFGHGYGWRSLGDGLEEDGAPAYGVLLLAEEGGQVELRVKVRPGSKASKNRIRPAGGEN